MTRKEILNAAKSAGITEVNGVNFTRCSNVVLLAELDKKNKKAKAKASQIATKPKKAEVKVENPYEGAFVVMATFLEQQGLLDAVVAKAKAACK